MTVEDALSVVVPTPVAPVIAPVPEMLIDGEERNFVNPVAKEIPLITFAPLLFAVKLMPLITLLSLTLDALVRARSIPFVVTDDPLVFALVRDNKYPLSLLVDVLYVSLVFPLVSTKFPLVKVALPAVKVKLLPVATVTSPLSDTAPVPVPNVPVPDIAKLPLACVYPVMFWRAPAFVKREVPPVKSSPSARFKFATLLPFEFNRVRVDVDACCTSSVVDPPVNGTLVSAIVTSFNVLAPENT